MSSACALDAPMVASKGVGVLYTRARDVSKRPRVLVLTLPFGGGHARAADLVAGLLTSNPAGVDVEVLDLVAGVAPRFRLDQKLSRVYVWASTAFGGRVALWVYLFANRFPGVVLWLVRLLLGVPVRRLVGSRRPSCVVTTFSVLSDVVKRSGLAPRVVSVVTDAGSVNRLWFASDADHYLLADAQSLEIADGFRLCRSRLTVVESLTGPSLRERRTREAVGRFRVLVTGGSEGCSRGFVEFAEMAARAGLPAEVVIVTGKNVKLTDRLDRWVTDGLSVLGWCPRLSDMIAEADLVVGKAGWLTMSEAFAAGKPYLIIDTWGRQEEVNAARAESAGWAKRVSAAEAVAKIRGYALNRSSLSNEFVSFVPDRRDAGSTDAAIPLAEALDRLVVR